jgi:sulfotransferase
MEKTYHFMAGLPRSGSTVLAALLNQHPEVHASQQQSNLVDMLYGLHSHIPESENFLSGISHDGFESVLKGIPVSFYSSVQKPIVIDQSRAWGTPYNFSNLSPYVNENGKVIITLRPILDILASFIKVVNATEKITGEVKYLDNDLWLTHFRSKVDAQVENIMRQNGVIDQALFSITNLLKNYPERVHLVWFDQLLGAPQETMNGIYDFLEISKFENNFKNIKRINFQNDFAAYGLLGLHDVANELKKPDTEPADYLSDYVISKYKNAIDFLLTDGIGNVN